MEEEMMPSTQEDTVGDIGSPIIPKPLVDVVRLAIRGWPVAAVGDASAVSDGHPDALLLGEESFVSSDVHALAVVVESDRDGTRVAEMPFDGRK
jgi:hypothetical protein